MTIKDFARLCGCNPQTLRYYDRVDLLKPVQVDRWSGYRVYDREQALEFVRIKNLQKAGFTIGEIKKLLGQDNAAICAAFEAKIAEQTAKLLEIKRIQQSYLQEMCQMQQTLQEIKEYVLQRMRDYDPTEEFGIDGVAYEAIMAQAGDFFDSLIEEGDDSRFRMSDAQEGEAPGFLNDPDYETVYERHGWQYVSECLQACRPLTAGVEYAFYVQLVGDESRHMAFANTLLGVAMSDGIKRTVSANVDFSPDDQNHFWLLKRRTAGAMPS